MSYQPQALITPLPLASGIPSFTVRADRHQPTLSKLVTVFAERRPVALMISESKFEASHVIGVFLAGLADHATIVRLNQPHADALTAMQEITRALGFAPKDLCLSDLRKIIVLFLDNQRTHRRRTVLCVEQADQQALWLLDTIASLVRAEVSKPSGLMVVLSGSSRLNHLLSDPSIDAFRSNAGRPIRLEPFTLPETRAFIRDGVEAAGIGEVSRLFDFDAMDRLHALSKGEPDTVGQLYKASLLLAKPSENHRVTAELVVKAARRLGLETPMDVTQELAIIDASLFETSLSDSNERLVAWLNGETIQDIPLTEGQFVVGRTDSADICLPSPRVSRRHVQITKTAELVQAVDLGSKNGTFVANRRITECTLQPNDVLVIGDCEIQYVCGRQ